ncbi:hypothetical protein XBKB1_3320003 [Xenorhabdus bovienii str. kraussei Becker Underwood]|uniref:Uncharacterized protein n=1 Tax=Xenorhabdus bovienii str. kraussei Becker Underwood TaxID=1398204 RepID=A0A077PYQ1_XENBV|nr:hypothetical protein XBKB1_3320003 [Xenorhabdus bovienii str. kraussei Becker Underwood]
MIFIIFNDIKSYFININKMNFSHLTHSGNVSVSVQKRLGKVYRR